MQNLAFLIPNSFQINVFRCPLDPHRTNYYFKTTNGWGFRYPLDAHSLDSYETNYFFQTPSRFPVTKSDFLIPSSLQLNAFRCPLDPHRPNYYFKTANGCPVDAHPLLIILIQCSSKLETRPLDSQGLHEFE